MSEKELVLQVRNLKTGFETGRTRITAVRDVSFEAYAGRILGIVGESGCGKSVTAHSITQLLPRNGTIENGELLFYDESGGFQDIAQMKPDGKMMRRLRSKSIGMVFQDPMRSLNPVYSVGSQIMEKLLNYQRMPVKQAKEVVIDLLERLNIPEAKERFKDYPHQFSGGMKQRIIIAIALVNNPRLLIADEPTTALDVTIQAQILDLLKEIQKDYNSAVILITHNMGIVAEVADDIAVMYMGRIMERGSTRQIFSNPAHPYTRALLKSVPVLGLGSAKRLAPIRGVTPDPRFVGSGCSFAPRCDFADECCEKSLPPEVSLGEGHGVSCHKAAQINSK